MHPVTVVSLVYYLGSLCGCVYALCRFRAPGWPRVALWVLTFVCLAGAAAALYYDDRPTWT